MTFILNSVRTLTDLIENMVGKGQAIKKNKNELNEDLAHRM